MKNFTKNIMKALPFLIIALLIGTTVVYAVPGNSKLSPSGNAITDQMYSLQEIYELATNGTPAGVRTGDIAPTHGVLEDTGVTLTQVYNAVATALEGVGGAPTLTWQPASDPVVALNLCFSHNQYEIDAGCSLGSGFIDASLAQDGSLPLGAVEYCQYLNEDGTTLAQTSQNIWHLPTIAEYTSITDYTLFNNATAVTGFAEGSVYWSSTESAEDPEVAWFWSSWYGYTNNYVKNNNNSVRCAR